MGKYTKEEFIKKARQIHGDKYNYSKVEYIDSKTKVCIICPEHGEFWQIPSSHLHGNGCRKCGIKISGEKQKLTKEEFILKAREIHGNKYDYSKVEYINALSKINIICPEHGEFWQKPNSHLNNNGCPRCGNTNASKKNALNKEEFILKARQIHGWKYDYSKVEYKNNRTKVCIICPKHGEFWQTPLSHLYGNGCRKCSSEKLSKERIKKNKDWINEAKKIHNNRYSYEKTVYTGYMKKVIITCPIHGDFEQLSYNHLQGKGCPKCRKSRLEIEMEEFLLSKNLNYIYQFRPKFLHFNKSYLSVDFYLPDYNIAIECQGKQHFVGKTFYSQNIEDIIRRDKLKKETLEKNNITVLYYTNEKIKNYFGEIFNSKENLFKRIKNGKLL